MLPFSAQGSNQAVEDGVALGIVLNGSNEAEIKTSLLEFETLRKNRTARIQILSSVRAGREAEVQERLSKYLDSDVTSKFDENYFHRGNKRTDTNNLGSPATTRERCIHDWRYVY